MPLTSVSLASQRTRPRLTTYMATLVMVLMTEATALATTRSIQITKLLTLLTSVRAVVKP